MKRSKKDGFWNVLKGIFLSALIIALVIFVIGRDTEKSSVNIPTITFLSTLWLGVFRTVTAWSNNKNICAKKRLLIKYFVVFFLLALLIAYVSYRLVIAVECSFMDIFLIVLCFAIAALFIIKEIRKDFIRKDSKNNIKNL